MKIGFVSTFYTREYGGAEVSTRFLAHALLQHDIDISVITPQTTSYLANYPEITPLPLLSLVPKKVYILGNWLLDRIYAYKIVDVLKTNRPDLLHVHDLFSLPAAVISAACLKIPIIITVRDNLPREFYIKSFNVFLLRNVVYKYYLNKCNKVIAISDYIKRNLIEFGIPDSKIEVIYNVLPDWNISLPISKENKQEINILAPGRLDQEKGFDVLLQAFAKVKASNVSIKLTIVGSGPLLNILTALVKELRINDDVLFIPKVPNSKLSTYYNQADIIVFPSVYQEPLGRVALEAGLSGKPIVASRVGGIPEIVDDTKAGFLYEATNVDDLTKKLLTLTMDNALRKRMGEQNRKYVTKKFNSKNIIQKTINCYKETLSRYDK